MRIHTRLNALFERLRAAELCCSACGAGGQIKIVDVCTRADGTQDDPGLQC